MTPETADQITPRCLVAGYTIAGAGAIVLWSLLGLASFGTVLIVVLWLIVGYWLTAHCADSDQDILGIVKAIWLDDDEIVREADRRWPPALEAEPDPLRLTHAPETPVASRSFAPTEQRNGA